MISNEKKALLHVGKQKLGLSEKQYRLILVEHAGYDSSAAPGFTDQDFKKVIDHFKILGFEVKRNFEQTRPKDPDALPLPEHLDLLKHIWNDFAQYVPAAHGEKFRQGFHMRLFKKPWPQTRHECNVAVEAMKVRLRREIRRAGGVGTGAKELG
jgi:hypothetical protein